MVNLDLYRSHEWEGILFFVDDRMNFSDDVAVLEYMEYRGQRVILCTSEKN